MTHSGGKSHIVGDRGQRYEVRALGWPKADETSVIGWSNTDVGARKIAEAIAKAPSCKGTEIFDRQESKVIT